MTENPRARAVIADLLALFVLILISFFATSTRHFPAAITFGQVLALELLVMAYPISKLMLFRHTKHFLPVSRFQVAFELVIFAILAAGLAYGNYLFFYARHGYGPAYMDPANPLHRHATTISLATLAVCQLINLTFVCTDRAASYFSEEIWTEGQLWRLLALAVTGLLVIVYIPGIRTIFGTHALDLLDWLTAAGCGAVYLGIRLVQRHTRQHSRHAVIGLHRSVHGKH